MPGIFLPKIVSAKFTGYGPLFPKPVELAAPSHPGPFLIIGGNGLGKTTMLQSVIFAIAGGADKEVFDDRRDVDQHWNQKYFAKRLAKPKDAEVRVVFTLGETKIEVRRGLDRQDVRGVRINDEEVVNSSKANSLYEKVVVASSGCDSFRDFRFIVHRLCYLAENRRSLVWDIEGQLGVSLLICAESNADYIVRTHTKDWQEAYNEMRHVHVSLTNLQSNLDKALSELKKKPAMSAKDREEQSIKAFEAAKSQLTVTTENIVAVTVRLNKASDQLQKISKDIEIEEQALDQHEEAFTLACMLSQERADAALALQKMLVHRQCPFCAQKTGDLALRAKTNVKKGLCPICGQDHSSDLSGDEIESLRKKLDPKLKRRKSLQEEIDGYQAELRNLHKQRLLQEAKLDNLSAKLPRVRASDTSLDTGTGNIPRLKALIATYKVDYERKEKTARLLKNALDAAYSKIAQSKAARFDEIRERVAVYATKFLGVSCTFEAVPSKAVDKNSPFTFPLLVPSFKGIRRTQSTQCSESQAFFLDIAFRMAVIDLATQYSGCGGTFVCETPENSLDLAYADNVADMFAQFTAAKCHSLLTANLQSGGVAEPLLKKVKSLKERKMRAFNMLSHAELSDVQKKKRTELDRQFEKLVS